MGKSKRLNRDHAKKTQRPMVEDRVIAENLTALLAPIITSQSRCLGARSLARETRAGSHRFFENWDLEIGF